MFHNNTNSAFASNVDSVTSSPSSSFFLIPSPAEPSKKIQMYWLAVYAACTAGGIASCGLTHMAVTPLDLVKCNIQIDPTKYKSITSGFGILLKEQGVIGFFKGCVPTLLGYSGEGACSVSMSFSRSTTLTLLDLRMLPSTKSSFSSFSD